MIKGSFIFAGGLVVGTGYGFLLGLRLTKAIQKIAEETATTPQPQTVRGETVRQPEAASA